MNNTNSYFEEHDLLRMLIEIVGDVSFSKGVISKKISYTSCLSTSSGGLFNKPKLLAKPVTTVSTHTMHPKIKTGIKSG